MKTTLIMIGFKSSGKTTVGRLLAERLDVPFRDLDDTIQQLIDERYGQGRYTVRSYFRENGADAFRDLETEALETHLNDEGIVLATGGGAPMRPENQKVLRNLGTICYIKATPELIYERFLTRGMPAYLENVPESDRLDRLKEMWRERDAVFSNLAHLTGQSTEGPASDVADEIYKKLNME